MDYPMALSFFSWEGWFSSFSPVSMKHNDPLAFFDSLSCDLRIARSGRREVIALSVQYLTCWMETVEIEVPQKWRRTGVPLIDVVLQRFSNCHESHTWRDLDHATFTTLRHSPPHILWRKIIPTSISSTLELDEQRIYTIKSQSTLKYGGVLFTLTWSSAHVKTAYTLSKNTKPSSHVHNESHK